MHISGDNGVFDQSGMGFKAPRLTLRRITILTLIASTMIALGGCSVLKIIQDEQPESDMLTSGEVIVICNDECYDRGQCGLDEQGSELVLMSSSSPALENHDRAIQSDSPVTIIGEEIRSAILLSSNTEIDAQFYQVAFSEGGQGWVAGWCLEPKQ